MAGIEYVNAAEKNSPWGGAMIKDSLVIGHSQLREIKSYEQRIPSHRNCSESGIRTPWSSRLTISNVTFVNFDEEGCSCFDTCAQCIPFKLFDGGAIVRTKNIKFLNARERLVSFPFTHATCIEDLDGSITNHIGGNILPNMGTLDPSCCAVSQAASVSGIEGAICKCGKFRRMAWNNIQPSSIREKEAYLINQHGRDTSLYRKKAATHKLGWTTLLPMFDTLTLSFQNSSHLTNISFSMGIDELTDDLYTNIQLSLKQEPDFFETTGDKRDGLTKIPNGPDNLHGDWFFGKDEKNFNFLIDGANNNPLTPATKNINLRVYRCFFEKCIAPTPPPAPQGRPVDARIWSNTADWEGTQPEYGGANGQLPKDGDDVMILPTWWMVDDVGELPKLKRLFIYGVLELENGRDHTLRAEIILISGLHGMLIAGWPDKPMPNKVIISLLGNHDTKDMPLTNNLNLGAKALGVFGRLQLFGKRHNVHWTRLAKTINTGDNVVELVDQVDWEEGDEILITTTTFESKQAEKFIIKSIENGGKTLELEASALHRHIGVEYSISRFHFRLGAKIALLTRNIRIEGANDPARSLEDQSFGCRVLVSQYSENGIAFKGKAQISEVQIQNCGQYGWDEAYDPR